MHLTKERRDTRLVKINYLTHTLITRLYRITWTKLAQFVTCFTQAPPPTFLHVLKLRVSLNNKATPNYPICCQNTIPFWSFYVYTVLLLFCFTILYFLTGLAQQQYIWGALIDFSNLKSYVNWKICHAFFRPEKFYTNGKSQTIGSRHQLFVFKMAPLGLHFLTFNRLHSSETCVRHWNSR